MLNNLTQVEQHDYSQNIFLGKVVYNQDPLKLKRVKVSVPNLFEGDPSKLPWVAPMFFGFAANGGGGGSAHLVPAVGTDVVIELQMGSPLHGLYIASPIRPGNLPAEFMDADWEWTYGWKDPAGNLFIVNTKAGANSIRILHASGTEAKILNSGRIQITGKENLQVDITGDVNATVQGNVNATVQGNVATTVSGNETHTVTGDFKVNAARIYLNES